MPAKLSPIGLRPPRMLDRIGLQTPPDSDGSYATSIQNLNDALRPHLADFAEKAKTIDADPDLKPEGKQRKKDALREAASAAIDRTAQAHLDALELEVEHAQNAISSISAAPTPTPVTELRAIEIRDWLHGKSDLERNAELQTYALAGNIEVVQAALNDPFGALVPDNQRQPLQEALAKASKPDQVQQAELAKNALATARQNVDAAKRNIGAVHRGDRIAIQAAASA